MARHAVAAPRELDDILGTKRVDLDEVGAVAAEVLAEQPHGFALNCRSVGERPQRVAEPDEVALPLFAPTQILLRPLPLRDVREEHRDAATAHSTQPEDVEVEDAPERELSSTRIDAPVSAARP